MSFNLGGIKQSFTFNSIKTKAVKKITIMVSKKANKPALKYNGLYYAKIVKNYSKQVTETIDKIVTEYHDVQNKFVRSKRQIKRTRSIRFRCVRKRLGRSIFAKRYESDWIQLF